ncbi:RNA polymerase sigma factor [Streptomyces sp. 2A115]|uniref:RNA polymerase sigma factor n=1 Tax=Streptomyces sp. 2A115 TaxID=3457439 RepID=UPI003FD2BF66
MPAVDNGQNETPVMLGFELQLAKDAAQEAMTMAYRDWSGVREPKAWVRIVGWRVANRQFRRHADEWRLHAENPGAGAPGPGAETDPQRRWESKLEEQAVLDALRRLPPRQRQAMAWRFDGFTPAEIADHLGKPAATVRSHLRHARELLKSTWPDVDGDEGGEA